MTSLRRFLVVAAGFAALSCVGHPVRSPEPPLAELRKSAASSSDPEVAATWVLRELVSPGGRADRVRQARAHLDTLGKGGMLAALARGLDDALHGRLATAAENYLTAVERARDTEDERAPVMAWFAANRAISLSHDVPDLWKRWKPFVESAVASPRSIGWRARSELVEWSIDQAWVDGATDMDAKSVELYGCVTSSRLAGPFGHGAPLDATRWFPPEAPGPWPYRWNPEPGIVRAPKTVGVERKSCAIRTEESLGDGIFYVQTFFDLPAPEDVLIAVQSALLVRVDDAVVLDRDVRTWGVWPKFGFLVRLPAGHHRLVARLSEPTTSIRLMHPDGTPLGATSGADQSAPYATRGVDTIGEPNVLVRWVRGGRVVDAGDDMSKYLLAFLAHLESSDDAASLLVEPLVKNHDTATGPALSMAALVAGEDPIFDRSQATDVVRELHERAVQRDPGLWASELALLLGIAERKGAAEAVPNLEKLAAVFPGVPDVDLSLARIYGELGWSSEHDQVVKRLVEKFPNDLAALHGAVDVYDAEGDFKTVDRFVERIQRLDRDDDIALLRALSREDYAEATREIQRFIKLHPEQEDLAERLYDVKVRAGDLGDLSKKLEAAVKKEPTNPRPRLELADLAYAMGDKKALYRAVADAVQAGANASTITDGIDLVEGATELEPFRLDARAIIDAYEKSGHEMPGTAARILDYAALWVRADGSSRMLEHEIIRLQTEEGIANFAEHRALEGLVLHMRVIKKDGSTLEPEPVPGKPTVTFPHLEVGDYIETEQVLFSPGDGKGIEYIGPRWFFREENVGYARSEFLVVTPESKDLVVETTGSVPEPTVTRKDGFVTRRWRVDFSPAAPTEPGSAPVSEFLPSVQIGWGVTLDQRLRAISDVLAQLTPVDPRIRRIAEHIVESVPASDVVGRARRLYRWLMDNVEAGDESDARRVIVGKHGNLWQGYKMLCRALDLPIRYGVAQSRLASPPKGPISAAMLFSQPVARVGDPEHAAWLTLGNKYAPFGYVPAELRGMKARFVDGATFDAATVPDQGTADAIVFSGKGQLAENGQLTLELVEQFTGRIAIGLRRGLSQVPEQRLHDVLESDLLAKTLHGGELDKFSVEHRDDSDEPLVIRMSVKVSRFAERDGKTLRVSPPLAPDLGRLATLPMRQTPLLLGESVHRTIDLSIELPAQSKPDALPSAKLENAGRRIAVSDSTDGRVLRIARSIDLPAGRVQPEEYAEFARFAHQADDALSRPIMVRLP